MHNLSDDELDRLSREAAEQHRVPADASSWEKIAMRLERDMPSGQGFNYHVIPDLALLFLLFIGLPVIYSNPAKQPATYIQHNLKTNSGKNDNELTASQKHASAKPQTGNLNAVTGQPEIVKEPAENPDILTPTRSVSLGSAGDNRLTDKNSRESAGTQPGKNRTTRDQEISMGNANPVFANQTEQPVAMPGSNVNHKTGSWDIATLEKHQGIDDRHSVSAPSTLVASDPFPKPAETKKLGSPAEVKGAKSKRKNDPASQSSSLLEFGITWSPDFSKVGEAPVGNVGNIAGFIAAFNFNKRWSVNTGILYSNKNYTAMGNEYQKIPGYNPADPFIKIKQVQAECLMWDLPINVRYNWYWRPKQRAFASTGLSSYFMKEEDLKYWYTYYNNPRYKEWVNTNSSSYWLSVLNLSAGFEQQLFEGVTVQAEPFLKLSLREVGYGKVNLKSWGVFLGLKYIPPIHRIKK